MQTVLCTLWCLLRTVPDDDALYCLALQIKDVGELQRLSACPSLTALALRPNPGLDAMAEQVYRGVVVKACPALQMLDGKPVSDADRDAARTAPDASALSAVVRLCTPLDRHA